MNEQLDILAFEFFKLFAKYESYLKEKGYFEVNRRGQINVQWDRFANQVVGRDFLEELGENSRSALYILKKPPKQQGVNEKGKIIWKDVPNNERSVQILFGHICRVRNNLYHGAKFNGTWFDPRRSFELLENSLVVLKAFEYHLQEARV
ncbi:hypothetical protein [Vibrio parahaemolyticus]|uniref:hypothetical protein n=1 Tax=Vibrio parahaemolyticus TaxID=670 RepID=UPI001122BD9D|nr:hypothetical protein [Vibrio parahaemolyticus]QLE36307.1 hypothetical protein FDV79_11490 [Vibrio parahaemolyticus]TOQ94822.1 hypothetical protein CGG84_23135 [Vibrio parahaemolyticus]